MFNFFKKDKKEKRADAVVSKDSTLYAPVAGEIVPVSEVSDPVFSQKMMGDGYAVIPSDGDIYSPAEGSILSVFPTKHAIGIKLSSGLELLLHMGLDTVELNGKPFEVFVGEGDTVTADTLLARVNLDELKAAGKDTAMVVVITNMESVKDLSLTTSGPVSAKASIGTVKAN